MDIVFYIVIFMMGAILGSLCARIIQRLAKGKEFFTIHSYCPNCGKKIDFFDKIPIFSYIFLKGKCGKCKKKIESQYIILEILTGLLFLISAYGLNLNITNFNITNLISFIFVTLYFSYIILSIGLDKENKNTSASLLGYGTVISLIYIIYLSVIEKSTIYTNVVYLVAMVILLLLNILNTKKRAQSSYVIDILTMLLIMLIFTGEIVCIVTIIATLISISLYILIKKIKTAKNKGTKVRTTFNSNLMIAFIMGTLNLFVFSILINL